MLLILQGLQNAGRLLPPWEVTKSDVGYQGRGAGVRNAQREANVQERMQGSENQGCCQVRCVCVCVCIAVVRVCGWPEDLAEVWEWEPEISNVRAEKTSLDSAWRC